MLRCLCLCKCPHLNSHIQQRSTMEIIDRLVFGVRWSGDGCGGKWQGSKGSKAARQQRQHDGHAAGREFGKCETGDPGRSCVPTN